MRFARLLLSLGAVCTAGLIENPANAQVLRYTTTAPGGIVTTGNTLGLSKATNENGPGTRDSIGTFLSLGNSVDVLPLNPLNPWPQGTTNNWLMNGSSAELSLPVEAQVLYAELLWGGSYQYGEEDVSALLGSSVTLTQGASSMQVTPAAATAITTSGNAASGFAIRYYLRSADVTDFVKAAQTGTYSVSGVPGTQTTNINSLSAAGWTLVTVYRDQSVTTKNLSVFVGGAFVDEDSQQDYAVTGFCAPPAGVVEGTAAVSAIEGDANLTGDQFLIGASAGGPFASLSGPNNPGSNFFCSQINDGNGQLDTSGSFGQENHNAQAGVNIAGGRQGWDITTIPLSSQTGQLANSQTAAVLRTITTGDSYMPILAALAIDVNSPDFGGVASDTTVSPSNVTIGDQYTVSVTLANDGAVTAQNVVLDVDLPAQVSLVSFTTDGQPGDINGNAVNGALLASGVDEGDIPGGGARTVTFTLEVNSAPAGSTLFGLANWNYDFEVCANASLSSEVFSQSFAALYNEPVGTGGNGGGGSGASGGGGAEPNGGGGATTQGGGGEGGGLLPLGGGGSGAAGGAGGGAGEAATGGGNSSSGEAPETGLGCSCRVSAPQEPGLAALAWGLVGLLALRRKRGGRAS